MKTSNKKNLSLSYIVPVLCSVVLGASNASAATSRHQSDPMDGLYFTGVASAMGNWNSSLTYEHKDRKTQKADLDFVFDSVQLDNVAMIPFLGGAGYKWVSGNAVTLFEGRAGFTFRDMSAGSDEGPTKPTGSSDMTPYQNQSAGKVTMSPNFTASARILPGAFLSETVSLHALFGFDVMRMNNKLVGYGVPQSGTAAAPAGGGNPAILAAPAEPPALNELKTSSVLFGATAGSRLQWQIADWLSMSLDLEVTRWFKGDDIIKIKQDIGNNPEALGKFDKDGTVSANLITQRVSFAFQFYPMAAL